MNDWPTFIRQRSQPLAPRPTDVAAILEPLDGIQAVLFDVYGTLIVSGCGDISLAGVDGESAAFSPALRGAGITLHAEEDVARELFHSTIRQHQQRAPAHVIAAEVDIVDVWTDFVHELTRCELASGDATQINWQRLALDYEMRANPVWPMPGVTDVCHAIRDAGLLLGIVSNAQFFTRELFAGLCGESTHELGFDDELCVWSFAHLRAKPDPFLYELAAAELSRRGIAPERVFYVGNDMRNDVAPAAGVGFRTGLFAGDRRSLRLRDGDPLVAGVTADRVVTDLRQIPGILRLAGGCA